MEELWLADVCPSWGTMRGIKNRAAAWVLNCLVFIGSYISLFSFWLCIYQVKGLSHCSISAVPEFTAKQGNMAINLISCCSMQSQRLSWVSRIPLEQIPKRIRLSATKENNKLFAKWWFLNCMAPMPFFGKVRVFKWSVYRTTDRIYEKRGQSAPALILVSLSPHSWQEPEWAKASGAVQTLFSWWTSNVSLTSVQLI